MIAFFIALLAAMAAFELYSLRHCLDGIEFESEPSERVAEPDSPVALITRVTNRSARPVPFLRVEQTVPLCLSSREEVRTLSATDGTGSIGCAVYLMPRQRLTRRTEFSIPARGRWVFPGATLSGGDFLGLSVRAKQFRQESEIVVLPRRLPRRELEELAGGIMGDISVRRFLYEDPVLTSGLLPYTGREPLKAISWTATARRGSVTVRRFDRTAERSASVLLDLDTFAFGPYAQDVIEKCYSAARGICEQLEEMRVPYSFAANALTLSPRAQCPYVPQGYGPAHLARVLECLGRGERARGTGGKEFLASALARAEAGDIVIAVVPVRQDADPARFAALEKRTGEKVRVVVCGEERT